MRRFALVFALIVGLGSAGVAEAQKQRRFPPRKPLPASARYGGVGPVLASPPSARYVAYRYGYRFRPYPYPYGVVRPYRPARLARPAVALVVHRAPVVVIPPPGALPHRPSVLAPASGMRRPPAVTLQGLPAGVRAVRQRLPVRLVQPPARR